MKIDGGDMLGDLEGKLGGEYDYISLYMCVKFSRINKNNMINYCQSVSTKLHELLKFLFFTNKQEKDNPVGRLCQFQFCVLLCYQWEKRGKMHGIFLLILILL